MDTDQKPVRHVAAEAGERPEDAMPDHFPDHFIEVESRRAALDALADNLRTAGASYLDAGCATGTMLEDTRRMFPNAQVVGADPFLPWLRKIRTRDPASRVAQFDLCAAPFRDRIFDAISCLNVLEHIDDDVRAIREIHRMLKPHGSAFLMVPAGRKLYNYFDEVVHHVRRYGKRDFRDKITGAGLAVRSLKYMGIFMYPAFYVVKKYGQWKMRNSSLDEKRKQVWRDVGQTNSSAVAASTLTLERKLGALMPQLFGIRLCAHVKREP